MDEQTNKSANIIDHRGRVVTHGLSALIGAILATIGVRVSTPVRDDPDKAVVQTVSTALDRGQDFWADRIPQVWRTAHVVLIDTPEQTACGLADKESGPFYCPPSERIYVDLGFVKSIRGDLARAYVIAHELGHHVQKLRRQLDGRNQEVIELQADCYAGMWMHEESTHGHLQAGDFEAAIAEAQAVGDDRINPGSSPESWTHGSAAQRAASLAAGFGGGPCQ